MVILDAAAIATSEYNFNIGVDDIFVVFAYVCCRNILRITPSQILYRDSRDPNRDVTVPLYEDNGEVVKEEERRMDSTSCQRRRHSIYSSSPPFYSAAIVYPP